MEFIYMDGETALEKELMMKCPTDLWVVRTSNEEAPFAVIRKERAEGEEYIRYAAFNDSFLITGIMYNDMEIVKGADIHMIETTTKMSRILNKHMNKKNFSFYDCLEEYKENPYEFQKAIIYNQNEEFFDKQEYLTITVNKMLDILTEVMKKHKLTLGQGEKLLRLFIESRYRETIEELSPEELFSQLNLMITYI